MINYLQCKSRPEMSTEVHQTARVFNNPTLLHEKFIKRLGRYLLHTNKEAIICNPDMSKNLEVYVGADFTGSWSQEVGDAYQCKFIIIPKHDIRHE